MSSTQRPAVVEQSRAGTRIPTGGRPLYRREPWLAVLLASLVITSMALFLPDGVRRLVLYVGLALGLIGVVLLMLHKPDPAEEAAWRDHTRDDE